MPTLADRPWLPAQSASLIRRAAEQVAKQDASALEAEIGRLAAENRSIHERDCVNLNPATNTMNPRAEALLASGIGSRPSLGYPGDKYEMGLEAIEQIEALAAALAAEIFGAPYVELRVPSGALANLMVFMACTQPGEAVITPPAEIGGHVTHQAPGAAGLYGLTIHPAPVDAEGYTVDVDAVRELARRVRPRLISIGGSLNLFPHPIAALREIADEVGAWLLFDAAHLSGPIAGKAWQQPLAEGAHVMTMSTYKSLGGPPAGLIVSTEAALAQRLEQIAFPGLTANFDAAKTAALAVTLLDWRTHGRAYGAAMAATAKALAEALAEEGLPVHAGARGYTQSHQFALQAAGLTAAPGGQAAAQRLRRANLLSCGIGLPLPGVPGDLNGLRLGSNELARWGMGPAHMPELAHLIARALPPDADLPAVARDVTAFRRRFPTLQFVR